MTAKELIAIQIERAVTDLFRSAKAMPEDRLNAKSAESCRSPLELLQECAQSLKWAPMLLKSDGPPNFDPEAFEKARQERAQWTTIDACEEAARKILAETLDYIENYPESDLDRMIALPFMPDLKLSVAEILASPYWNLTYHLGQINFIQTTYGDMEMH